MDSLTETGVIKTVKWAVEELAAQKKYQENAYNSTEFLFAEHHTGWINAGGNVNKCIRGFNIDFDNRCTCCGTIFEMGSVDIEGPDHSHEAADQPIANPGITVINQVGNGYLSIEEAGKKIFKILTSGEEGVCDC